MPPSNKELPQSGTDTKRGQKTITEKYSPIFFCYFVFVGGAAVFQTPLSGMCEHRAFKVHTNNLKYVIKVSPSGHTAALRTVDMFLQ